MLKGQVAVVTGSTSGIGLAIATAMAREGATVVLNGFGDLDEIEVIRASLEREHGVDVSYLASDLSSVHGCFDLIRRAIALHGKVDILVNNAGIQYLAPIEQFPVERWDAIIALNLSAVFHCTAALLPMMKQAGYGRIINIASAHGLVASVHKAAYVAAKHGVIGLTKVTALETAGQGITCNAICPGWTKTLLSEKQIDDYAAKIGRDRTQVAREMLAEKQPSEQYVLPEQLGAAAVFLASPAAAQNFGALKALATVGIQRTPS